MKVRTAYWIFAALLLIAGLAYGQDSKKDKETHLRTVSGVVADKSDNPLSGSVVFLKNTRTNAVSSRFTDDRGTYKFSGLDPNADYEVHAEMGDGKSSTKTVSSLDGRKEIIVNLKIDRKKS